MDATTKLPDFRTPGNRCHPSTRHKLLRAIVKLDLAASELDEAFEADDTGLRPPLAVLSAEARTVADRARLVLRNAA